MGCCSNFNDKYQECEFLIDEFKLIILQSSSDKYTENEREALNKFKYEKEEKIRNFLEELEKKQKNKIQKRKIQKLKNDFSEILDEDEDEEDEKNSNNDI